MMHIAADAVDAGVVSYCAREVARGLISSQTGPASPIFTDDAERRRVARLAHRILMYDVPANSAEALVAVAFLDLDHRPTPTTFSLGIGAARHLLSQ